MEPNNLPDFILKIKCPNCNNWRIVRRDKYVQDLCRNCFAAVTKLKIIDKDKLKYLYIDKNMSSREIGKLLDISHRSILNWLKKYNIKPHDLEWKVKNKKQINFWKGKSLPEKTKKKISEARIKSGVALGDKNPNWKGGISTAPYCFIWSDNEYKDSIKERDTYKCRGIDCRKNSKRLCLHHIDYDKKNCHPDNLITLCVSCNSRANFNEEYWKKQYNELIGGGSN